MNSADLIEYIKEASPTGEVRESFAHCLQWMFNRELCHANLHPPLNDAEKLELERRNKLEAVKQYKRRVGCRLIEAKDRVEQFMLIHYKVTHFSSLEREV